MKFNGCRGFWPACQVGVRDRGGEERVGTSRFQIRVGAQERLFPRADRAENGIRAAAAVHGEGGVAPGALLGMGTQPGCGSSPWVGTRL